MKEAHGVGTTAHTGHQHIRKATECVLTLLTGLFPNHAWKSRTSIG